MSIRGEDTLTGYHDLEVQTIYHTVTVPNENSRDLANDGVIPASDAWQQYEVLNGRLDNDEVAELLAFYRAANCLIHADGTVAETAHGAVWFEQVMAFNEFGDGVPIQAGANFDFEKEIDVTGGGSRDVDIQSINDDRPSIVDAFQISAGKGFTDAATGVGGGDQGGNHKERYMDFGRFGGPVVDASDDIFFTNMVSLERVGSSMTLDTYYILYWDVERLDDIRPAFGRPS